MFELLGTLVFAIGDFIGAFLWFLLKAVFLIGLFSPFLFLFVVLPVALGVALARKGTTS